MNVYWRLMEWLYPELRYTPSRRTVRELYQGAYPRWFGLVWGIGIGVSVLLAQYFSRSATPAISAALGLSGLRSIIEMLLFIMSAGCCITAITWTFNRRVRRRMREVLIAHGYEICVECGYDLHGQESPRCPECGTPFHPPPSRPPPENPG